MKLSYIQITSLFLTPVLLNFLSNIPLSFCMLVIPPKISIGFVCTTNEFIRLQCKFRENLLKERPDLIEMVEKHHTYYFNDQDEDRQFVGLICTARYPVKWQHFQEQWVRDIAGANWLHVLKLQISSFQRTVKNIDHQNTYRYSHLKVISNHVMSDSSSALGEYTCGPMKKSVTHFKTIKTPVGMGESVKFSVFRNMSVYDSVFPLSEKNITIYMDDERDENGSIVLPCYVSTPNAHVTLYRKVMKEINPQWNSIFTKRPNGKIQKPGERNKTEERWEIVPESAILHFQPSMGFIFNGKLGNVLPLPQTKDFHISTGMYKCTATYYSQPSSTDPSLPNGDKDESPDQQNEDWVIVNVEKGHKKKSTLESSYANPPANFNITFLNEKQIQVQLKCCSSSSTAPRLYWGVCTSREDCDKKLNAITEDTNGIDLYSRVSGNCADSPRIYLNELFMFPLVFRCIGDGIDYRETLIFPFHDPTQKENDTKLRQHYSDWDDVDPYMMVAVKPILKSVAYANDSVVLYENQNVTFQCYSSIAYFAVGTKALVNFANGSRLLIPDETKADQKYYNSLYRQQTQKQFHVVANSGVKSVSCFAPVKDSARWIEKTLKILLKKGENVTIKGELQEEISWVLNDTNKLLKCEFAGMPVPDTIIWKTNGKIINSTQNTTAGVNASLVTNYQIQSNLSANISVLQVKIVHYEVHNRTFECIVKNVLGEARKSFRINVTFSDNTWISISVLSGFVVLAAVFVLVGVTVWRQRQTLNRITNPYEYQNGGI